MSDTLAERRARLIDLITLKRLSDSRGRGLEGAESDREAIEADVMRLPESTVGDLITRLESLQGVVW